MEYGLCKGHYTLAKKSDDSTCKSRWTGWRPSRRIQSAPHRRSGSSFRHQITAILLVFFRCPFSVAIVFVLSVVHFLLNIRPFRHHVCALSVCIYKNVPTLLTLSARRSLSAAAHPFLAAHPIRRGTAVPCGAAHPFRTSAAAQPLRRGAACLVVLMWRHDANNMHFDWWICALRLDAKFNHMGE